MIVQQALHGRREETRVSKILQATHRTMRRLLWIVPPPAKTSEHLQPLLGQPRQRVLLLWVRRRRCELSRVHVRLARHTKYVGVASGQHEDATLATLTLFSTTMLPQVVRGVIAGHGHAHDMAAPETHPLVDTEVSAVVAHEIPVFSVIGHLLHGGRFPRDPPREPLASAHFIGKQRQEFRPDGLFEGGSAHGLTPLKTQACG
jgi:hypothetical protein